MIVKEVVNMVMEHDVDAQTLNLFYRFLNLSVFPPCNNLPTPLTPSCYQKPNQKKFVLRPHNINPDPNAPPQSKTNVLLDPLPILRRDQNVLSRHQV